MGAFVDLFCNVGQSYFFTAGAFSNDPAVVPIAKLT